MLCETERGCPVEAEARNPKIDALIDDFIKAKVLQANTGLPEVQRTILERTGLLYDVDLLEQLEAQWIEYITHKRKQEQSKNKAKKPKKRARRGRRR